LLWLELWLNLTNYVYYHGGYGTGGAYEVYQKSLTVREFKGEKCIGTPHSVLN
jgi:hypothetical protein